MDCFRCRASFSGHRISPLAEKYEPPRSSPLKLAGRGESWGRVCPPPSFPPLRGCRVSSLGGRAGRVGTRAPLPPGDSLSGVGSILPSTPQPRVGSEMLRDGSPVAPPPGDPSAGIRGYRPSRPIPGGRDVSPPRARHRSGSEPSRPRGWTPRAKGLARPAGVFLDCPSRLRGMSDGLGSRRPLPGHRKARTGPLPGCSGVTTPTTYIVVSMGSIIFVYPMLIYAERVRPPALNTLVCSR